MVSSVFLDWWWFSRISSVYSFHTLSSIGEPLAGDARINTGHRKLLSTEGYHWQLSLAAVGSCQTTVFLITFYWRTKWRCWELNHGSSACQACALPLISFALPHKGAEFSGKGEESTFMGAKAGREEGKRAEFFSQLPTSLGCFCYTALMFILFFSLHKFIFVHSLCIWLHLLQATVIQLWDKKLTTWRSELSTQWL